MEATGPTETSPAFEVMCSSEGVRCTVTTGKAQPSHLSLNCGDDVEVSVAISAEHTAQGPELQPARHMQQAHV